MDKQRDQVSNNSDALQVPFSNSKMDDNVAGPDTSTDPSDDRGTFGPERMSHTGMGPATLVPPNAALPPDPHAPPGDRNIGNSAEVSDYGIKDSEVATNGSVHQYGLR